MTQYPLCRPHRPRMLEISLSMGRFILGSLGETSEVAQWAMGVWETLMSPDFFFYKEDPLETSLVIQWLGI